MKDNNQDETDMKKFYKLLNKLIKDQKIKFSFYNNSLLSLDLLNLCYNKNADIIEFKFRDIMAEHLAELREIMDKSDSTK